MSILELIHLLLAPFTFFSKAFLELIINGGNVEFALRDLNLVLGWDIYKFRRNHKKFRVFTRVRWVLEIASNLYRVSGSVSKLITTVIQKNQISNICILS